MNDVIQRVRFRYPQYNNYSDDELTLRIGQRYPGYMEVPSFAADYNRLTAPIGTPRGDEGVIRGVARGTQIGLKQLGLSVGALGEKGFRAVGATGVADAILESMRKEQGVVEQMQRDATSPWATKLSAGAVSILPTLAGGLGGLGIRGLSAIAGTQSGLGTLAEAERSYEERYLAQGIPLETAREQARRDAWMPALSSGIATGIITRGFGATGVEAISRESLRQGVLAEGVRNFAKSVGRGAISEGLEEGSDQIAQSIIAYNTYNPDLTLKQATSDVLDSIIVGGVLGGGVTGAVDLMSRVPAPREQRRVSADEVLDIVGRQEPQLRGLPAPADYDYLAIRDENGKIVDYKIPLHGEVLPTGEKKEGRGARGLELVQEVGDPSMLELPQESAPGDPAQLVTIEGRRQRGTREEGDVTVRQQEKQTTVGGVPLPEYTQEAAPEAKKDARGGAIFTAAESVSLTDTQKSLGNEVQLESGKVAGAEDVVWANTGAGFSVSLEPDHRISVDLSALENETKGMTKAQRRTHIRKALEEEVIHNAHIAAESVVYQNEVAGQENAPEFSQWFNSRAKAIRAEMTPEQVQQVQQAYGRDDMSDSQVAAEFVRMLTQQHRTGKTTEGIWRDVGLLDNPNTRNWFKRAINWFKGTHGKTQKTRSLLTRMDGVLKGLEKGGRKARKAAKVVPETPVTETPVTEEAIAPPKDETPEATMSAEDAFREFNSRVDSRTRGLKPGEKAKVEEVAMRGFSGLIADGKPIPEKLARKSMTNAINSGLRSIKTEREQTREKGGGTRQVEGEQVDTSNVERELAQREAIELLDPVGEARQMLAEGRGEVSEDYAEDLVSVLQGDIKAVDVARKHKKDKSRVSNAVKRLRTKLAAKATVKGVTKEDHLRAAKPRTREDLMVEARKQVEQAMGEGRQAREAVQEWVDGLSDADYAIWRGLVPGGGGEMSKGVAPVEGKPVASGSMRRFISRVMQMPGMKQFRTRLRDDPRSRRKTQSLSEMKEKVADMTDAEIMDSLGTAELQSLADGTHEAIGNKGFLVKFGEEENWRALAWHELVNRKLADESVNEDAIVDLVEAMAAEATELGRGLRQVAEFTSSTPLGIIIKTQKQMAQHGVEMTETQATQLFEKVDKFQAAVRKTEVARKAMLGEPKEQTFKDFKDAMDLEQSANNEVMDLISDMTPRGAWETLRMVLQGNLLTPISQVANVAGNVSMLPFRGAARTIAQWSDAIWSSVTGTQRTIGSTGIDKAIQGGAKGLDEALIGLTDPGAVTDAMKGEIRRGFRPIRALMKLFSDTDAPTKVKLERAIEGTVGMPAEAMFRLLNLGDKPFRRAAEMMHINEQAELKGLKDNDRVAFMLAPDPKTARAAKEAGDRAVFAQRTLASSIIEGGLRRLPPGLQFFARTITPYIRTPIGILAETFSYAVPYWSAGAGVVHAFRGNRREALMNMGKSVVGMTIWGVANALIEKGLLAAGPDKDEDERQLQYEVHPPNTLNITALSRSINGGDSSPRAGDTFVKYEKLGVIGAIFHMATNSERDFREAVATGSAMPGGPAGATPNPASMVALARYAVDQSFLAGTSSLMKALTMPGREKTWLREYFNTITAIPLPNTLAAAARADRQHIPDSRDADWIQELRNVWAQKIAGIPGVDHPDLPVRRNLWGNPIEQTPEGSDPVIYNMFDVFKTRELTEKPVSMEIYRLYHLTKNRSIIPNPPNRSIKTRGGLVKLTPEQYDRFSQLVGQERHRLAEQLVLSPTYAAAPDVYKQEVLERLFTLGLRRGKQIYLMEQRRKEIVK